MNSSQGGVAVSVFRAAYFHNLITLSDDGWWLGQLSLIAADGSLSHALVTNPGMGGG